MPLISCEESLTWSKNRVLTDMTRKDPEGNNQQ